MTTLQRLPVQVWTPADVRSLKWGSILFGVGVGLFLPRGMRRYGRVIALAAGAFAIKPLMVLLREDTLICNDRPLEHGHTPNTPAAQSTVGGVEAENYL